jgi:lactoylglutathione lyase
MKKLFIAFVMAIGVFAATAQHAQKATINHTAIYVKDVSASAHFYKNIVGLDTLAEPFHDGLHAWFKTGPGIALHIIQGAAEKKTYYKNQHTCFSMASVDVFVQLLIQNNITWEDRDGAKKAITTRVDGVKQIWLQDPDGYWIEVNDARE